MPFHLPGTVLKQLRWERLREAGREESRVKASHEVREDSCVKADCEVREKSCEKVGIIEGIAKGNDLAVFVVRDVHECGAKLVPEDPRPGSFRVPTHSDKTVRVAVSAGIRRAVVGRRCLVNGSGRARNFER